MPCKPPSSICLCNLSGKQQVGFQVFLRKASMSRALKLPQGGVTCLEALDISRVSRLRPGPRPSRLPVPLKENCNLATTGAHRILREMRGIC